MEEKMCSFKETCLTATAVCTKEEMLNCGEVQKRQELAKQSCPLMARTNGGRRGCDISQLRVFVPSGANCHEGDKCLVRKTVPEIAARVAGDNGTDGRPKVANEEIKEAGKILIASKNFIRQKLVAEKATV